VSKGSCLTTLLDFLPSASKLYVNKVSFPYAMIFPHLLNHTL